MPDAQALRRHLHKQREGLEALEAWITEQIMREIERQPPQVVSSLDDWLAAHPEHSLNALVQIKNLLTNMQESQRLNEKFMRELMNMLAEALI